MVEGNIVIPQSIFLINEFDKFVLYHEAKQVTIDKSSNLIKKETLTSVPSNKGKPIYGVIGILEAREAMYLMTIDKAIIIGNIMGHKIFRLESVGFHSNQSNLLKEAPEDVTYIQQIRDFFNRNTFYFSQTLDLSVSIYGIAKFQPKTNINSSALFPFSQTNLVWNFHNTRSIDDEGLIGIVPALINGFVGIRPVTSYDMEFSYVVVSRKENKRSGCRFIVRGVDMNGNVANFAETEQFIVFTSSTNSSEYSVLSYLQIRGSIPLIWSQLPNLKLNPTITVLNDFNSNFNAFTRHMTSLIEKYDRIAIVNLIDKKGDQKIIGDLYQEYSQKFKQQISSNTENTIDYTWFDFHSECKKMKYNNICKLLMTNSVSSSLNSQDFTQITFKRDQNGLGVLFSNYKIDSRQKGVFRTNCIDNLDRTNVVQSVFARQFLHKMLYKLHISEMPHGNPFEEFVSSFEFKFREFWGENGDIISKAYSGTNALKRDFTRTGKRTIRGALDDGINTSTRFYINNFCDGYNQDCHDYYLGLLNPRKKTFKPHSTLFVNSLFFSIFVLGYFLYSLGTSFSMSEERDYGVRGIILKSIIMIGMFLVSTISLMTTFKTSIIDLSTISYN